MKKPQTFWVIKHWGGVFYPDTARSKRTDAIAAFKSNYGITDRDWRDGREYGVNRAVRATFAEVPR